MKYPLLSIIALVWTLLSTLLPAPLPAQAREMYRNTALIGDTSATIWQSASTNACSSLLQITPTGFSSYLLCQQTRGQGTVPPTLTQALFRDLAAAQPLNRLPLTTPCLKSASFGATIYIVYANQISPDLDCVADPIGRRLVGDVHTIQKTLWENNDLWMNHQRP